MSSGGRLSLLAIAAASLLAGCGGDDGTIPADRGEQLTDRLNEVESGVAAGQCEGAQASADLFVEQVDLLPAEVDDEVKQALRAGGERLQELATAQCEEPDTGATGETGVVPPEEPVEEAPVEPPPDEQTTDEEPQQPDDDESDGQGQGQDGGNEDGGNEGGGTSPGTGGVGGGD